MPDLSAPLKLGANCWNQYSDWSTFFGAFQRAEALGFDSLWTWDHLYPIVGSPNGPMFEAYTAMSAVAQATTKPTIGLMVGANTFRNPGLVAKMVTTIDHISNGRAVLGIGAAWFETEHLAFGIEYGEGPPERLRWLGEALPVMRGMLRGEQPSAAGRHYKMQNVRNDPPPVQKALPLLVGGSGKQVTLKLVARYADMCNLGGGVTAVREGEQALLQRCEEVGRDEKEIERTVGAGATIIRDSREEARAVFERIFERNGRANQWTDQPVGTPEDVAERFEQYLEMGYRHLIINFPSPYDEETMTRLAQEVRPRLERAMSVAA